MGNRISNHIMAASAFFMLYISLNTPLSFLHFMAHDDGLFMGGASNILKGNWLGVYNQFTLAKGPVYSFFLALGSLSGLSISIIHVTFQLLAIYVVSQLAYSISGSKFISTFTFAVLSLNPISLIPEVHRVIRDQIYWPLSLLVFSTYIAIFILPMKKTSLIVLSTIAGVLLAVTWLTREEGIWLLPGLTVLAIGSIYVNWTRGSRNTNSVLVLSISIIAFFSINCVFYSINYFAYGSFSGVDFKERNFTRVVDLLQSIDSGPIRPLVPVSLETRRTVAAAVPSFTPLQKALEPGQPLYGWQNVSCEAMPSTCGEIAGGWFVWALRDAAAQNNFYMNPTKASLKYGEIADEIELACADGRLKCRTRFINFLPPMTFQQWSNLPLAALKVAELMAFINVENVSKIPIPTSTEIDYSLFVDRWEMLNRPTIFTYNIETSIAGWYYDPDRADWPEFEVKTLDGQEVESHFSHVNRPDLAVAFKDTGALQNGFKATFFCPSKCEILARIKLNTIRSQLSEGSTASSGKATLHLDVVTTPIKVVPLSMQFSLFILADLLVPMYKIVIPFLVFFGFCAFVLIIFKSWRSKTFTPLIITASVAYIMVGSRITIISLVEISSFPAVNLLYSMPGNYLMMVASILSIAAYLDFFRQTRHKMQSTTKQ